MNRLILLFLLFVLWNAIAEAHTPLNKLRQVMRTNATKCLSRKSKRTIPSCKRVKRKARDRPSGFCYRYVKLGLYHSGIASRYMGGQYAKDAGKYLRREGFRNHIKKYTSSYRAPIGSELVYGGGSYGHIEVKLGRREYASDYIGNSPVYDFLGLDRRLIGVYIKE